MPLCSVSKKLSVNQMSLLGKHISVMICDGFSMTQPTILVITCNHTLKGLTCDSNKKNLEHLKCKGHVLYMHHIAHFGMSHINATGPLPHK